MDTLETEPERPHAGLTVALAAEEGTETADAPDEAPFRGALNSAGKAGHLDLGIESEAVDATNESTPWDSRAPEEDGT
jgi:hypothetical protein